ncbi:hypothetical protein HF520_07440 [Romboutsia sp. CE17]|uniref:hypothetical protein n=1 Tax=Romboutsia sp. CE17 TaxID=2724150 RepID=UPI001442DDD3|nr:hypothetical protein [Romboutsia sp. CE17]QJA08788.1 hypothetical protein HF520_07440 [Romboutsia sp. CE17]
MNKFNKKIATIVVISMTTLVGLVSCNKNEVKSKDENILLDKYKVNEDSAKALYIEDLELKQINKNSSNRIVINKIKNISSFNISDIWLVYNELDSRGKIISESKMFLDMTLKPKDIFNASFNLKESSETINIIGYEYIADKNDITVNLKDDSVKISEKDIDIKDSYDYEVLDISDMEKLGSSKDGENYLVKVKNTSSKNLGNITLKIAELNKKGEYIRVYHESPYSALKPLEEADITIKSEKNANEVKIIGYIYDDIDSKSNIDIDLEANEAQVTKY